LVGKIVFVSLKKGVERGFVLPGYPEKSFHMRRVLKVFRVNRSLLVSHKKGVEKYMTSP